MKKIIYLLIIFLFICPVRYVTVHSQEIRIESKYTIDGRAVTEAEFSQFKDTLKEVKGTWFCAETNKGGITGYDAKDQSGILYEVRYISDNKADENSISKKNK